MAAFAISAFLTNGRSRFAPPTAMGTEYAFTEAASGHLTAFLFNVRRVADSSPCKGVYR